LSLVWRIRCWGRNKCQQAFLEENLVEVKQRLQERGILYIVPATEVYEGMVIGNTSKGEEMMVNPTKGKNLTNVRSSGNDEAINLVPAFTLTIERGLEIMAEDEYLEITPESVRLRKQYLSETERARARR